MFRGILGLIVSVVIIFLSAGALAAARISLCKTKEEKAVFCRGGKFFFLIGGRLASSRGAAVRFRSNRFLYRDERRGNDLSYFSAVVRMGGI